MHTILSAALRSRLVHQIQKALHTEKLQQDREVKKILLPAIPLKQIQQSKRKQIEYVSAVALKYAPLLQQPTLELAENLIKNLNQAEKRIDADLRSRQPDGTSLENIQRYFNFEVAPSGWIFFQLAAPGLAIWLQCLADYPLPVTKATSTTQQKFQHQTQTAASVRNSTSVFLILHTYTRCHSVLCLGQQFGLLQMLRSSSASTESDSYTEFCWQLQMPQTLPWLQSDGNFRSHDPAEWQLIEQICTTLDEVSQPDVEAESDGELNAKFNAALNAAPDPQRILRQADRLSQSWQMFYAQCRIADETGRNNPQLAQVRLGLTWITWKLLHYLLRSIDLPTPLFL